MSWILPLLLSLAILLIDLMIGGTRLVFSLPGYALLVIAGCLSPWARGRRPNWLCLSVTTIGFTYLIARAWLSPVEYLARPDLYSLLACLLVYYLSATYLSDTRSRSLVIASLLVLAVVEVFFGLRQFSQGDNWMPFGFIRADYGRRASGSLISSIHLAGFLEVVGGFALSCAFWSRWRTWGRLAAGYVGVLCFVGVAITGSRGGYLSSVASLLTLTALSLYVIRRTRPERFVLMALVSLGVICAGLGGGVALMSLDSTLRQRLSLLGDQLEPNKLDVRVLNWQATLDQARMEPWTGTGAGTHLYYGRYFRRPSLQVDPIHSHSDYLELLAEYGIFGAAAILAILLVHAQSGLRGLALSADSTAQSRSSSARSTPSAFLIGALCAGAAYLVHSAIDFNLHIPGHALLFAFIFGLLANPQSSEAPPPVVWRWAIVALALGFGLLALPKWPGEYGCEQARVALRNRNFGSAISRAEDALRFETRNPDLYFHLAEAHRAMARAVPSRSSRVDHYEQAIHAYRSSLGLFPRNENAWVRLGQALDGIGAFQDAEVAYQRALQLDPNLAVLHVYYADHLEARGRTEEARIPRARAQDILQGRASGPKSGPANAQ